MEHEDEYVQVAPGEVAQCVSMLMQYRGAFLLLDKPGSEASPVVLLTAEVDRPVVIDISSAREVAGELRRGTPFRLLGESAGKLLRSSPLTAESCREVDGAMHCLCPFPETFELLQRRHNFRAALRQGLECDVTVSGGDEHVPWDGELGDLSMTGCLVKLPLGATSMLAALDEPVRLGLCFPSGRSFAVEGMLRHQRSDMEQRVVRAGFEFLEPSPEQSRELWFFVREIERETARSAAADSSILTPSELFQPRDDVPKAAPRRRASELATPMARNLTLVAEFLNVQILALRNGESIDSVQLSRHAERLLGLLEQSREALLFAIVALPDEPLLVRHCLAVAVRLVDMAGKGLPRDMRKAMLASAMVHDLGQVLLPPELLQTAMLDTEQRAQFNTHTALLLPRLEGCTWLNWEVMQPVVEQSSERLDGSGYPRGLSGDDLRELARMMAVAKEADLLARNRPGHSAWSIDAIHRHLQAEPSRFDQRWVKRYIQHFGRLPVGTLLRFPGGKLVWVRRVDEDGRPIELQWALQAGPPRAATLGDKLSRKAVADLGEVEEILSAEAP